MTLQGEADARRWLREVVGCDRAAFERLEQLERFLCEENRRQNLVSAASLDHLWVRHFADSAQLLLHTSDRALLGPWLDLGAGAGFPGLVVAICRPEQELVLVESRAKRIEWLRTMVSALGLSHVAVAGMRVERLGDLNARVISARAFAPLQQLIAVSARFSTSQTLWLLPKGRSGRQELTEMPNFIQRMFHVEQSVTDAEALILVGQGQAQVPGRKP